MSKPWPLPHPPKWLDLPLKPCAVLLSALKSPGRYRLELGLGPKAIWVACDVDVQDATRTGLVGIARRWRDQGAKRQGLRSHRCGNVQRRFPLSTVRYGCRQSDPFP